MEEALESCPLENLIEALLFVHPEPLPLKQLEEALSCMLKRPVSKEEIQAAITTLQARYAATSLEVYAVAEGYAFRTRPAYGAAIAKFLGLQRPIRLSKALLETLAVIAYHQPVTKAFVSHLRGTNSDYAVEKLLEGELIEPAGRADLPGRPLMYRTTPKFLELLGLRSLTDLPRVEELGA